MSLKERREARRKAREEKRAAKERAKQEKLAKKNGTYTEEMPKENPPKEEETVKEETPQVEETTEEEEDVTKEPSKERKASTKKVYHISYRKEDGQWQVKLGGKKVLKLFKTQAEGIEYAKSLADNQDGSIVIHMKDGTIRKQKY